MIYFLLGLAFIIICALLVLAVCRMSGIMEYMAQTFDLYEDDDEEN